MTLIAAVTAAHPYWSGIGIWIGCSVIAAGLWALCKERSEGEDEAPAVDEKPATEPKRPPLDFEVSFGPAGASMTTTIRYPPSPHTPPAAPGLLSERRKVS